PPVEQLGPGDALPDLQVMTRHTLVVDGGHLLPGGEGVDALRYGPPHAARPGEVLARAGVVDATVRCGREAALDAADRLRNVEVLAVQLGQGPVGELLHPVPERLLALDPAGRVGLERRDRVMPRSTGDDLVADSGHLGLDAGQLGEAPMVGLV